MRTLIWLVILLLLYPAIRYEQVVSIVNLAKMKCYGGIVFLWTFNCHMNKFEVWVISNILGWQLSKRPNAIGQVFERVGITNA